jgi:O-methyltransferase
MPMYSSRRVLKTLYWLFFGGPTKRRRIRQECARIAASLFGDFPISEDHKLWREDKEFLAEYQRLSPDNPYSQDRKFVLRELARFTRDVPGCMAECGCYKGGSAYFMAKENPDVPLHLFDSFEGLSEPNNKDLHSREDHWLWERGSLVATEEEARKTLSGFDHVVFHKGWIPDRFPEVKDERFRLVHIDVDLYQPTLDSLEFFYPRMNSGGVIVLDDYGFTTCPGAYRATVEFTAKNLIYVLHLPTGQGIITPKSSRHA